jgi:hypothetical protein
LLRIHCTESRTFRRRLILMKTAPWLRHMVRQIAITDFPASWQRNEQRNEQRNARMTR